ncbi:hypothetical protein HYX02_02995 [Candidatus Woesearchaeota archaeon]|nr:hypothetical protein [Candidatus Woesearchaeota archaeon]
MKASQQYESEFRLIRRKIEEGAYGLALYRLVLLQSSAISNEDVKAIKAANDLEALIRRIIWQDFSKIALERRLIVTPENLRMLMEEHSRHYIRYMALVSSNLSKKY